VKQFQVPWLLSGRLLLLGNGKNSTPQLTLFTFFFAFNSPYFSQDLFVRYFSRIISNFPHQGQNKLSQKALNAMAH